jgi:hypothetical protein
MRLTALLIVAAGSVLALPSSPAAAAARVCGSVAWQGDRMLVRVERGHVSCFTARRIIRYVNSHGPVTQGAPGRSPKGWECGWSYGRASNGDNIRAGASCTRHGAEVASYASGIRPY